MAATRVLLMMSIILAIICPFAQPQSLAPAPAPSSDGTSIDQGIAYGLMIAALLLTYLIHPLDAYALF
ncbi:hypothetical protein L6452_33270 [Arctium lappa]|uniref:Uncharacterized protein n=1 Tax=Arctium lappa TaxID=4217 RepID=A0ACB8Z822_ARCLA|nr:hypothetical protein L6452_33270 [Arctium lappa]